MRKLNENFYNMFIVNYFKLYIYTYIHIYIYIYIYIYITCKFYTLCHQLCKEREIKDFFNKKTK